MAPPQGGRVDRSVGAGPRSTGTPTATGLNSDVHGAAVAVAQCRTPPRRSVTHEPVVWLEASVPPAWTHGAVSPPWARLHRGDGPDPWHRSAPIRSAGPRAAAASDSVTARRCDAPDTHVRARRAWARAKPGMDSPLEIDRPGPRTSSVAHDRPAVSTTTAPSGSATRKLLS